MAEDVITILKKIGAVLTDDHFVYTSGKHGSVYINKDALYPHTAETAKVGELFAQQFKDLDIDIVAAPAVGGTILCQWTAYYLSGLRGKEILAVYTEKDKGTLAGAAESEHIFRRGYDKLIAGKNVLVIEDLTTTGISVRKVVDTVRATGGRVVAVGVMVNRNPQEVNSNLVGAPFHALGVLKAEAFDEAVCPLCNAGVPVNTGIGHGKKYMEEKGRKS